MGLYEMERSFRAPICPITMSKVSEKNVLFCWGGEKLDEQNFQTSSDLYDINC